MNTNPTALQAKDLAALSQRLFVASPVFLRKLTYYRIFICPFEHVIPHIAPGSSVLDVGCGAGLFLGLAAKTVPGVTGVGFDTSDFEIDTASRMAAAAQIPLQFHRLDVAEPWPAGLFDVVSLVDVLHHVPPQFQRGLIARAVESVKPNGILLYKDMADTPWFPATMNRLHDFVMAGERIHYLPIQRFEEWASELGLAIAHAEEISRFWYRHQLRICRKPA